MACRCEDLKIMERDKERLKTALGYVKNLDGCDGLINLSLRSIGDKLPDTLIVPDPDVCLKMNALNDKCQCAVSHMNSTLSDAKSKLSDEIWDARWEDIWYHATHPVETVQGWLG